ncbi:plasmid pRiA4b ORF-3 family protein [Vibrio vulnificus]|uniref:plasmid pRiA4b ORF-3 family protein n=1 Tax=Vibrio vulnificus TaxID=672 RepID=UPI003ED868ED
MIEHLPPSMQKLWSIVTQAKPFEQLKRDEVAFLADPGTLLFSLPIGITMPDEVEQKVGEQFLHYFDYMVNELNIRQRNDHAQEQGLLNIINQCLLDLVKGDELNLKMAYSMVKTLKSHQLPVDRAVVDALGERQVKALPNQGDDAQSSDIDEMAQGMAELLNKERITSGFEFCQMFSDELAVYPIDGVRILLACAIKQKWIVDALLLLTMHKESDVAAVAAEVLNEVEDKQWKSLTNRNYLLLVQRFADEGIKAHLPKWNRLAMKYAKESKPSQVVELYVSFADGNQSSLFLALMKGPDGKAMHQVGGVFRIGYGLVDSHYVAHVDRAHFIQMVEMLKHEVGVIPCDPILLRHLLPWAMHEQKTSPERMSVEALQTLASLPNQWSEPHPFDLAHLATVCHFDEFERDWHERARFGSKMLLSTPMFKTWLVNDIDPAFKKARQVRDHYYLAQPQQYIKALTHAGLLAHFALLEPNLFICRPQAYLACAKVLQEGNVGRKQFSMFDWLAEKSLLEHEEATRLEGAFDQLAEPAGYVLKVTLSGSKPQVWRRFTVSNAIDMQSLHYLLQDVMGWENAHPYSFATPLGHIDDSPESKLSADKLPLMAVLRQEGDSIGYVYDFGDHWEHVIVLEKINKRDCLQPKITAGSGACPPEDCGGIWGYAELLKAVAKTKRSEDEQEQLEWYGMEEGWDARAFDKQEANALLLG